METDGYLSCKILKDAWEINRSTIIDDLNLFVGLKKPIDTINRELKANLSDPIVGLNLLVLKQSIKWVHQEWLILKWIK